MKQFKLVLCLFTLIFAFGSLAWAEEKKKEEAKKEEKKAVKLEEMVVESKRLVEEQGKITIKSEGLPAQVDVITKEDIERLDVKDYVDLFRKVPGVTARTWGVGDGGALHSFSMRGYTSYRGRDIAILVDGVPQNFASAGQGGTGSTDMSWLTPEMIERIEVIKGPFSALYGDFALAGAINIITKNKAKSPSVALSGGSFGTLRSSAVISKETWSPTLFLNYAYDRADGYRDNSDYENLSLFNKLTMPLWDGNLSLRFSYYKSDWGEPGYPYLDDVKAGIFDRKSAVNPTDGGEQERYSFVVNHSPAGKEDGLYITAYIEDFEKHRFGTWNPKKPQAQSESGDDRRILGGRIFYNLPFGESAAITAGVETRYDDADTQGYNTTGRQRTGTTRDWGIEQLNLAAFLQAQAKPVKFLKIVGGVRYDYFDFDIENRKTPANSGKGETSIFSPKIGFIVTPVKNLNIFANKGFGFRSPAASEMSPVTGRKNLDLECAKVDTWDIGFNTTLFEKFYLAFDYYQTNMEREIRVIDNEPVNIGDSKRDGYEVETKFYATPEVALFASYAWVDAKIKNPVTPGQDRVTQVPKDIISCGIEITKEFGRERRLRADFCYQYVGPEPVYSGKEVTPIMTPHHDIYNLKLAYDIKKWSVFASALYKPGEYPFGYMWATGGKIAFSPVSEWNLSSGVRYQF
jgi:outer membrane receptor protein involved in Fe transport